MSTSVDQSIAALRSRDARLSAAAKLGLLAELEGSNDPRILPLLVQIMTDSDEPAPVRVHVLKHMRNGRLTPDSRPSIAAAMLELLADAADAQVRLQVALALGNFTDIPEIVSALGAVAMAPGESIDLRYAAFTSLERTESMPRALGVLRQLASDEVLGLVARRALAAENVTEDTQAAGNRSKNPQPD
jgi:hypothetical protein